MHDEMVKIALGREAQLVVGLTDDERRTMVVLLTRMSAEIPKLSGD
jgi:hypothetical protein